MAALHTPGPWTPATGAQATRYLTTMGFVPIYAPADPQALAAPASRTWRTIAWVGGAKRTHEQALVDATLVAASPMLLQALRDLLPVAASLTGWPQYNAARDAIAAATTLPSQEGDD